jgi:hypothetical protein
LKDKLADADEEKSIAYFLAKPATNLACTGRAMCRPEGTMPHSLQVKFLNFITVCIINMIRSFI